MENFTLIIFGITGNLAQKKLLPALVSLKKKNLLPENLKIIGIARHTPIIPKELVENFEFQQGDVESDPELFVKIKNSLTSHNHLYYLATFPDLYAQIFTSLKENGLNQSENGWVRLIIEKPLGNNEESAKKLDLLLHECFKEEQIYRIDHYLGKITYQNMLVFRFSNEFFEPLLNRKYVDHIQITSVDAKGIENRGSYYDTTGTLKDVGQNHMLQLLVAATMEAPEEFTNAAVTKERIKILEKLVAYPQDIVFGQYQGYLDEQNVKANSKTDTFFALKTEVDNDCWKGVPIYIRSGKSLAKSTTEISIVFKVPKNRLFSRDELGGLPNILTYRVQPNEGIEISLLTKHPSIKLQLDRDTLDFSYSRNKNNNIIPDAYEKLIFDALSGDQTFFDDALEVEASWKFIDKLIEKPATPVIYKPGTWGPKEANDLIEKDGRQWILR